MEAELLELLGQSVQRYAWSSTDSWGNKTYGSAATVAVRIDSYDESAGGGDEGNRKINTPHVVCTLIANGDVSWQKGDKVDLPTGRTVFVTSVEPNYDETTTIHHFVLTCETGKER